MNSILLIAGENESSTRSEVSLSLAALFAQHKLKTLCLTTDQRFDTFCQVRKSAYLSKEHCFLTPEHSASFEFLLETLKFYHKKTVLLDTPLDTLKLLFKFHDALADYLKTSGRSMNLLYCLSRDTSLTELAPYTKFFGSFGQRLALHDDEFLNLDELKISWTNLKEKIFSHIFNLPTLPYPMLLKFFATPSYFGGYENDLTPQEEKVIEAYLASYASFSLPLVQE